MMSKETEKAVWGGAFNAFGRMFERLKANPQPWVLYLVVYLVFMLIQLNMVDAGTTDVRKAFGNVAQTSGVSGLFYLIFLLALPTYGLALAKGKAISIREFLSFDAKKYFSVFFGWLLYVLAAVGAALLLIIPAIWVIAWFALFQMTAIDKNLGPIQALKESKRLMRNHKGKVWGIIGATILLSFGAGLLGLVPVVGVALSAIASATITLLNTAAFASLYRWAK